MRDMAGPRGSRGRGRGRFGISSGLRPVSEESRIGIAEQLEGFQRSNETSKTAVNILFVCGSLSSVCITQNGYQYSGHECLKTAVA